MPLGNSTRPPTPWRSPPGFSATLKASRPPSLLPTQEDSPARFSHLSVTLSISPFIAPWRPPYPASSAAAEVTSQVLPPPAVVLPDSSPASLPSNTRAIAVRACLTPPLPRGLCFLLHLRPLRLLSTPLGTFVCTLLPIGPIRAVLPPFSVASYLCSPRLVSSPACLCRCRRRLRHLPPRRPCLATPLPSVVPDSPPCSAVPTPAVSRDPVSARSAPRAPSPGPGRRYCP